MNRNKLKTYAPQARRDFIQAVTQQAAHYGLTAKKTDPMTEKGEVVVIAGQAFPKPIGEKRKKLEARIQKDGFGPTMEAMAYTWFNRLVAIRFMELHGYLEHGFRVLSHPAGGSQPEIVEHAQHVDLPGLDQQKVIALKLDGTKEEELYRLVLVAQCNALHKALPFLFEKIDDETELLLPDKLLHSDSLIRKLVSEIDEEDWQEVEIIGWLYQFYISERKDEVIGKVVASEDIPAATQLFTPNWIVKYLVQNTLGRQWLATYPQSALRQKMEYYIEPAEQTPEVQEQLKAITPTELNPEELTLLDPACGSGHILVEAYDLFKAIYEERGRRPKDIPTLILTKNLFGLEIDDRAAQLAAFALMIKARADDRRIFDGEAKPNVLALQDSKGLNAADLTHALNSPAQAVGEGHVSQTAIGSLLTLFEDAKTFGSLIQIPPQLAAQLPDIEKRVDDVLKHGDLIHTSTNVLKPLLRQAGILQQQYDAVTANPPYMGAKYMGQLLKRFAAQNFSATKHDLFAMFIQRGFELCRQRTGINSMVAMQSWMYLASYEEMREHLLQHSAFLSVAHLGPRAFDTITGEVVSVAAFAAVNIGSMDFRPVFFRLVDGDSDTKRRGLLAGEHRTTNFCQKDFLLIPGQPLAYSLCNAAINAFRKHPLIAEFVDIKRGVSTGNNEKYTRYWWEVDAAHTCLTATSRQEAQESQKRWFPHNRGGSYRKWYGCHDGVIDYQDDGKRMVSDFELGLNPGFRHDGKEAYFLPALTWSAFTSSKFSFRQLDAGFVLGHKGAGIFAKSNIAPEYVLALLNSTVVNYFLQAISPTLDVTMRQLLSIPFINCPTEETLQHVRELVAIAKQDWDEQETSWRFRSHRLVVESKQSVGTAFESVRATRRRLFEITREREESVNGILCRSYGLEAVTPSQIEDEDITLLPMDTLAEAAGLLSFAVGCMMGRYSLDKPGLVYAHCGNHNFDFGQYKTFRADDDGIIPLTEFGWFLDDAASRFEEFITKAWPTEHLEENLKFVAESLGSKRGESPKETIRRYLATDFYKHHLSMYKKRPIYWLFSSGKQRGFQALVYIHRYNGGTLARMRTEYVVPLLGKMTARIGHLTDDIAAATSSQHKKRLETEKATVTKQLAEVQAFEEKLRHCADQRISLDLDDGVRVNYGKFGDLLAEVKVVSGGEADE